MRPFACSIALCVVWLSWADRTLAEPRQTAPPQRVRFNEEVRPVLAANCFGCHGFDAKQRKADLRLDDVQNATAERDGYFIVKPGDPEASEAWLRIISTDPTEMMPPPETKKKLTEEQKETLRQWIEQGAVYQKHWAFEKVAKPQAPIARNEAWVRNEVDRFILARLEREGLSPQPEADRPTLIRRVAFALTGLPPSTADVDVYLNDARPGAYEAMVERYLESPHFGEEFARHWLDLARYGDTHGLHLDNERQMWAYRDWVVQAFNENLPFDQFTIWQLAGDLLPSPTQQQQTATGFNRCNVTSNEGGSISEELLYRYAVDRTSTTIQTWMGLTAGCAQCHDHKYDPLTMKEFYQLYAFFNSAADPAMDGNRLDAPPFLMLPSTEAAAELASARKNEREAAARLESALKQTSIDDPAEAADAAPLVPVRDEIFDDALPYGITIYMGGARDKPTWVVDPVFGAKSGRRVLEVDYSGTLPVNMAFPIRPLAAPYAGRLEGWLRVDAARPPSSLQIQITAGKGDHHAVWGTDKKRTKSSKPLRMGPLPAGDQWTRIVVPLDGLGIEPGTIITGVVLLETGGRVWVDDLRLCGESDRAEDPLASFSAWWRTCHEHPPGRLSDELSALPEKTIAALKAGPSDEHVPESRDALERLFQSQIARAVGSPVAELQNALAQARADRLIVEDSVAGTFVYHDLPKPRESFVMLRGQYDKPGDPVTPDTPKAFPPLPRSETEARATRLDLARWLVSAEHPLTARVAVNRFWQQLFGVGLVKTSEDFGTQGAPPSHPELLDWLAAEFMAGCSPLAAQPTENPAAATSAPSGAAPAGRALQRDKGAWDVKALVRLLVNSATFRQQARVSPEALERDPENRLYARGPRFRLDAEQVRDNALFVSGLIDLEMGGRGVKPYQPPNIWEPVGYGDSNTRYYVQDHGSSLYRRGLYCFLKRTAPSPLMANFDGPSREQMCARRERSNTPLQALQLMNDVQFFEAARALGERALAEAGPGDSERIDFLYRTVLARRPDADEQRVVGDFLAAERSLYNAEPPSAQQAVHVGESPPRGLAPAGESAAWTLVANMLLNLDETVTRN